MRSIERFLRAIALLLLPLLVGLLLLDVSLQLPLLFFLMGKLYPALAFLLLLFGKLHLALALLLLLSRELHLL